MHLKSSENRGVTDPSRALPSDVPLALQRQTRKYPSWAMPSDIPCRDSLAAVVDAASKHEPT
jgi:hypothetical protein